MLATVLQEAGFVFNGQFWENPLYPWVRGGSVNGKGDIKLRAFMEKPKQVSKPEVMALLLEQYTKSKELARQYYFAMDTMNNICDELNAEFPNVQFFVTLTDSGVPQIVYTFLKSDITLNLAFYQNIMPVIHEKRATNFSKPYTEIVNEYLNGNEPAEDPIVKSTGDTINIFSTRKGLRNMDLWRIRGVTEVITHEIVAEFPSCPPLLQKELSASLAITYYEFVCSRKG